MTKVGVDGVGGEVQLVGDLSAREGRLRRVPEDVHHLALELAQPGHDPRLPESMGRMLLRRRVVRRGVRRPHASTGTATAPATGAG